MTNEANTIKLTAKQDKFAVGIAAGLTQSDAYRAAYNAVRMKADQVHVEASKLRNNPKIAIRIDELLKVARTEDVTNLGREIRRTMDLQQEALAALKAVNLRFREVHFSPLLAVEGHQASRT